MIALDVEASGLNAGEHSILSIGAVDVDDPTNQFYDECRMWEGAKIEEEASAINGFSEADAKDPTKKSEAELLAAFFAWATDRPKDRTLVAQNVSFDQAFVVAAAGRAGLFVPFAKRTLDLHTLVWLHMKLRGAAPPTKDHHSGLSLSVAAEYCGLPEEEKPHNGMTGALLHAEIVSRVAYTRKLLPEFESFDIPWLTK
jgi:DNA polymerase III epsilon subunit-like protein